MKLGIWCPAPLSIRPDSLVQPAFDALTRHGGGVDQNYLYAVEVLQRAEELGFEITLIAQRFFGPDLDSWMVAAALATQTKSIEIMPAVHPGIMDPRVVAKHAASIDRISGGRFSSTLSTVPVHRNLKSSENCLPVVKRATGACTSSSR